jgi:hypothetical protein
VISFIIFSNADNYIMIENYTWKNNFLVHRVTRRHMQAAANTRLYEYWQDKICILINHNRTMVQRKTSFKYISHIRLMWIHLVMCTVYNMWNVFEWCFSLYHCSVMVYENTDLVLSCLVLSNKLRRKLLYFELSKDLTYPGSS